MNRWEARGRTVKAWKIARVLARTCRDTGYPVDQLGDASELARAKAARIAGVHLPSAATWAAAVALVEQWVADDEAGICQDGAP